MTFRLSKTFTASLERLTAEERAAANDATMRLLADPAHPGLSFHRLDNAKDKRFWSIRANDDVRVIVHRDADGILVCYADHHDAAYRWAERRKLEKHPTTGAMQLVEIRERVEEVVKRIVVPEAVSSVAPERSLFAHLDEDALLGYGVPPEWVADAQRVTESGLFDLAEHLPEEAADALVSLAVGEVPEPVPPIRPARDGTGASAGVQQGAGGAQADDLVHALEPVTDPYEHPAARQRFRTIDGAEELERALSAPWEQWTVFLHPTQQELVMRDYGGPARVMGSAGTGKTVVALHRTVHLAGRDDHSRVLLATFSDELAAHLEAKLRVLTRNRPRLRERIDVATLAGLAARLHRARFGANPTYVTGEQLGRILADAVRDTGATFSESFLVSEWEHVVDAWQLRDWESYRTVARMGRKTRLPESARQRAWTVFEHVWSALDDQGLQTEAVVYDRLATAYADKGGAPYDHVVLDEAQDASASQLRFLARLVGDRPNGLFFAGDLGQRIFQQPFSWLSVGGDVRGRARTLKVNYRTSHQIRSYADRLLDERSDDVDGETQERRGTISVFGGPTPRIDLHETAEAEEAAVASWLEERLTGGIEANEIALFVRSEDELPRAMAAAKRVGVETRVLGGASSVSGPIDAITIASMHSAKGLEFRAVGVIACDEDVIPSCERLENAADMVELQEIHETERHLLYVAMTRARDELWVSGVVPGSEYLDDLR